MWLTLITIFFNVCVSQPSQEMGQYQPWPMHCMVLKKWCFRFVSLWLQGGGFKHLYFPWIWHDFLDFFIWWLLHGTSGKQSAKQQNTHPPVVKRGHGTSPKMCMFFLSEFSRNLHLRGFFQCPCLNTREGRVCSRLHMFDLQVASHDPSTPESWKSPSTDRYGAEN